jgi:hypothetical protein
MLSSWVLDDHGDIWPEASRNLGLALQTERSAKELTDFLVRQMGFVVIREFQGRNELLLDPEIVSPVALTAIFCWGADRRFQPTAWVDVKTPKLARVFTTMLALHNQVGALVERRTPRPDFELFEQDVNDSAFSAACRLATRICRSDLHIVHKLDLLEDVVGQHLIWAERADNGDFAMTHATTAATAYDPEFCATDRTKTFREASDRRYGTWTADQFLDIYQADVAQCASISALIRFNNRPERRYFYDRLVIPAASSTGRGALLIAVKGVRSFA